MSPDGAGAVESKVVEDRRLLEAVRRGDRQAFAVLYRRYHPRLHGYLRRLLTHGGMAEEVFDDVMFVVWKDAAKFRGQATVSTWIFGIAYRKALTALKKERRYQAPLDHSADVNNIPANLSQDREVVRAALAQLSPDHRQVVELTYFCGFSYQEIAAVAGCPVNTVKTRMYHARRRLKYLVPVLSGADKEQDRERA